MKTVHGWIGPEYQKLGIGTSQLPQDANQRIKTSSEAIDAVFILGKGFLYFDNIPIGFVNDADRQANPSLKWVFSDTPNGNLLFLFMLTQGATANIEGKWLNAVPYLSTFSVPGLQRGA